MEETISLYNQSGTSHLAHQTGFHPDVFGLTHLSMALALMGYPNKALAKAEAAVERASQSFQHGPSMAVSLSNSVRTTTMLGANEHFTRWLKDLSSLID